MALTDNILAYWKLDNDGSGGVSLVDSTGNGNALTNNNGVTLGTGIIGGDAVLNTTNYLETTILNPPSTGDVAVSFWMNPTTYGTGGIGDYLGTALSLCYQPSPDVGWLFIFNESGNLRVFNATQGFETPVIPLGEWTNIIVSRSSGTSDVYVNGQSVGSFTDNSDFSQGATFIGVPSDRASEQILKFDGGIDEVGFWSRALTSSEVANIYNSGFGITYPFALWYFNAAVNGSLTTLGNWWQDSSFTIPATALPNGTTQVFISANVTSGTATYASATINSASIGSSVSITASSITLNGTSQNAGILVGVTTLNNTASNTGTITGNATIYYPSANPIGGVVSGTETYIWPNGTGLWGGDVWIDGSLSFIIPEPSDVRLGVEYGPAEDPYVGIYGGKKAISISQLLKLPFPINI
jgi:hypothetical protein